MTDDTVAYYDVIIDYCLRRLTFSKRKTLGSYTQMDDGFFVISYSLSSSARPQPTHMHPCEEHGIFFFFPRINCLNNVRKRPKEVNIAACVQFLGGSLIKRKNIKNKKNRRNPIIRNSYLILILDAFQEPN